MSYIVFQRGLTECLDEAGVALAGQCGSQRQDGAQREGVRVPQLTAGILTPILQVTLVVGLLLRAHTD